MTEPIDPEKRLRVWLFGFTDNMEDIMKEIPDPSSGGSMKFFEFGGDEFVIVRADKVEPFYVGTKMCNIIIPVDAKDGPTLDTAKTFIENNLGIATVAVVKVESHNPWAPHRAHGYITQKEYDDLNDDNVGRQFHKSPGSNKWG